jgi:tetratricopeptide (TPR) repeat protein
MESHLTSRSEAYYHFIRSRQLLYQNRVKEALAELEFAAAADPEEPYLFAELASFYLRQGENAKALTAAEKASFEIVPDPVPREHQHYHSAQRWNFLLRFNGAPAASVPVRLLTSNGSELGSVSDANGRVSLMVPDDFSLLGPDVRDRRTAEFSLSAELERDGTNYQTQLSAEYRVDPGRWQSLGLGVFVTGIGLVAGGLLGRKALRSS